MCFSYSRLQQKTTPFLISILSCIPLMSSIANETASSEELLNNGGFESGVTSWNLSGDFHIGAFSYPHSGQKYSYLSTVDGNGGNHLIGTMYQLVSIPPNATNSILTYYWNVTSTELDDIPYDVLNVTIQNESGGYLNTVAIYDNTHKESPGVYRQASFPLNTSYAGNTIRINFLGTTDGTGTNPTIFRIDDVSVTATLTITPPGSPDLTNAIGNSDSILLGWTNVSNETEYKIQRSISPSSGFGQVGTTSQDIITWQDTSPSPGTIYYYRVLASNAGGNSQPSNVP